MIIQRNEINSANISYEKVLITPKELKKYYPLTHNNQKNIINSRRIITDIIHHRDSRLLVICGPCSIHDVDAALEYAYRLKQLAIELSDSLYIVMRVYFEKPRTSTGWKGLISDPMMDGSFDIEKGLHIARKLLLSLVDIGLPLATEVLDLNNPQYLGDLFSWSAIGARTIESQTHREIASGLSMPVGFKNGTDGNLMTAINAIRVAGMGHHFMGINQSGQICLLQTQGNHNTHLILRGGKEPNYSEKDIENCERQMRNANLPLSLMIDCSHDNSKKDFHRQPLVVESIIQQITSGNHSIIGMMLESYINEGNQSSWQLRSKMKYGISVTDGCISWETTSVVLRKLHTEINSVLKGRIRVRNVGESNQYKVN